MRKKIEVEVVYSILTDLSGIFFPFPSLSTVSFILFLSLYTPRDARSSLYFSKYLGISSSHRKKDASSPSGNP